MKRFGVLVQALALMLRAAPPGAIVSQKILVPDSMRTDVFATDRYVAIPPGFHISVWARVADARFVAVAPNGDVLVSQPDLSQVTLLRPDSNGGPPTQSTLLTGLKLPHGLAFDHTSGATYLYVAETDQIDRYTYNPADGSAANRNILVRGLPTGGHALKSIVIGPNHAIYVGIGSSCNACVDDTMAAMVRGSVFVYQADGSGGQLFAKGLRNPEGLAFFPGTDRLWAAVNNRDEILYPDQDASNQYGQLVRTYVDDHPPDPFTFVRPGGNYGWPFCNSTQDSDSGLTDMPFERDFELNRDGQVDCAKIDRISRGIQAHSAPLGFRFLQGTSFAAPYRNGAVMALHGSWDRTQPTGYKVVWFPWNSIAGTPGDPVDLITGLLGFGRPVDVATTPDGSLLVTDDTSGTIFRLDWAPSALSSANGYPVIAPQSYATVYSATPLPVSGNIRLTLTDSKGKAFPAPIHYASATQINFIVPDGMADGTAHLTLSTASTSIDLGSPEIRPVAPGLFTIAGDGTGWAAVTVIDSRGQAAGSDPIDMSTVPVYVSLYGTGIRHANPADVQVTVNGIAARVLYAGPQPTYPALDQVNIELPAALAGSGRALLVLSINGITSNAVELAIR